MYHTRICLCFVFPFRGGEVLHCKMARAGGPEGRDRRHRRVKGIIEKVVQDGRDERSVSDTERRTPRLRTPSVTVVTDEVGDVG